MRIREFSDLLLLAMLWGASFLFMRISVPEFGAIPMMAVRVSLAGLFLLPLILKGKRMLVLREKIIPISVIGIVGSALPFTLIAYSTLYVTAGFASVLNAATPVFAAIVAFVWLNQRLNKFAIIGLAVGLIGVVLLVWDKIGFSQSNQLFAVLAGVIATFCYGVAANYAKKNLVGVEPIVTTTGSLLIAAITLLPASIYFWPPQPPTLSAWINVSILALACTGFAQILFFRLIEKTGATSATTVTFLIPVFGLLWGYIFLDEVIQVNTVFAGIIILTGTALTTGMIKTDMQK